MQSSWKQNFQSKNIHDYGELRSMKAGSRKLHQVKRSIEPQLVFILNGKMIEFTLNLVYSCSLQQNTINFKIFPHSVKR